MTRRIRRHVPVKDAGFPRFPETMFYLFCIVLPVGMIVYLIPWLLAGVMPAWASLIAFCLLIGYAARWLAIALFPGRFRRCPVCSLVREIIEIDSTIR